MPVTGQKRLTHTTHRTHRRAAAAVFLILLVDSVAAIAHPKEKHNEEVEALFERARTVSDLEVEGGTPFVLEARVYVHVPGVIAEGHYLRVWQSLHRWRDELTFPRYSQVRVSTESAIWRQRNTNHQPLPVVQLLEGLAFSVPAEGLKGWKMTIPGAPELISQQKCVKYEHRVTMQSLPITVEWCFDAYSGVPTRRTLSDWDTRWEYLEYAPWNGKLYPGRINIVQGGERVVEARITVRDAPNLDPASFTPSAGSEEWPRCENAHPPVAASFDRGMLVFPIKGKQTLTPVLVEVGADGHVQDAVVLRPLADAEREHQLFVYLKQRWKFQPAKCGEVTVPFTMVLHFPI